MYSEISGIIPLTKSKYPSVMLEAGSTESSIDGCLEDSELVVAKTKP